MLLTIDEQEIKIARTSVFNCHLWPVGRVLAIKNSVPNYLWSMFVDRIDVFDCSLSGVVLLYAFVSLILYVPVLNLTVMSGLVFLSCTSTKQG